MKRLPLKQPLLLVLLGYPGSGKTYFARQFAKEFNLAHISSDRVRCELFDEPTYLPAETQLVHGVLSYLTEELVRTGASAVLDSSHNKRRLRREVADMARKHGATVLTLWVQTDPSTALERATNRDRRRTDEKYAVPISPEVFAKLQSNLQPPEHEEYVVISGKHTYDTQRRVVLRKLEQLGLLNLPEQPQIQSRAPLLGGRNGNTRRPFLR